MLGYLLKLSAHLAGTYPHKRIEIPIYLFNALLSGIETVRKAFKLRLNLAEHFPYLASALMDNIASESHLHAV